MNNLEDYLFYASTDEAFIYKILTEVLQNCLTDICFNITPESISLVTVDNKTPPTIEVQLVLHKDKFEEYKCDSPFVVTLNLQHKYKMLKNIKKKDSISFVISKNCDTFGIITRQQDTSTPIVSYIQIQKIQVFEYDIPTGYGHPTIIPSSVFQKTCKEMNNIGKILKISKSRGVLTFTSELENMYMRSYSIGKLQSDDGTIDEEEYSDNFMTKTITQFIKATSLCPKIRIYTDYGGEFAKNLPLRLSFDVGTLGTLDIYIKSKTCLDKQI